MVSVNNSVNNIFKNTPVTSTAVSYTALPTDVIINVTNTTSVLTITLPTASSVNQGKWYLIKDTSGGAGTNNIQIIPSSGTINGGSNLTISVNYGFLQVYNDGANWFSQATSSLLPSTTTTYGQWWQANSNNQITNSTPDTSLSSSTPFVSTSRFNFSGSNFVTNSSSGIIVGPNFLTIQTYGIYRMCCITSVDLIGYTVLMQIVRNGTTVIGWMESYSVDPSEVANTVVEAIYVLNAGDTIDFRWSVNGGTQNMRSLEMSIEQIAPILWRLLCCISYQKHTGIYIKWNLYTLCKPDLLRY